MMGYFGGVHLSILVAKICQLNPCAMPSKLLEEFFNFYSNWTWPRPIFLKQVEYGGILSQSVWNPQINTHDRDHVMPILTPAYPCRNTTHNASKSSLYLMKEEFARGAQIFTDYKNIPPEQDIPGQRFKSGRSFLLSLSLSLSFFFFEERSFIGICICFSRFYISSVG